MWLRENESESERDQTLKVGESTHAILHGDYLKYIILKILLCWTWNVADQAAMHYVIVQRFLNKEDYLTCI